MKFSHPLPTAIFGAAMVSSTIVAMQFATPVALAADVREVAREITVRIDGPGAGGSGFIVKREDDLYTVVTNWHVVDREGEYIVKTEDGREHRVRYRNIQQLPGADLAVMYFTSTERYRVAELGDSDDVRETDAVYVSGWRNPWSSHITEPLYSLIQGQITGRQRPNDDGYALIYNADGNYIGMSGGPLLTEKGKVIGVNGLLDEPDSLRGQRVASLAIPINTFERLQARVSPPANTERAEAFLQQGFNHFQEQDYESAIEDFNQAIRLNPNSASVYDIRGIVYLNLGDLDRAMSDFNQAIRIDPDYASAYDSRGIVYRRRGDLDRAISDFNQAIRIDPDYASAYDSRGIVYLRQGDLDRAISDFNQAIRLNPNSAAVYDRRGIVYLRQGDLDRAMSDFNQAIRIDPDYASAYDSRGIVYRRRGDLDRAMSDFNQAIRLNPDYADAYYSRGIAYYNQGDYERAIADYNQAIRLNPEYAYAYNNRGLAYSDQGDYERAIADYNQAIRINPEYAKAYYNRGLAYSDQGDYERAIADYNQAIRLNPEYANAYYNRVLPTAAKEIIVKP
jgi:tetratricopeptide (TPR) repeat protein